MEFPQAVELCLSLLLSSALPGREFRSLGSPAMQALCGASPRPLGFHQKGREDYKMLVVSAQARGVGRVGCGFLC